MDIRARILEWSNSRWPTAVDRVPRKWPRRGLDSSLPSKMSWIRRPFFENAAAGATTIAMSRHSCAEAEPTDPT